MKNFFVILGGMGTLATTNFLNDLNEAYKPSSDQEYLNYLVVNHATIPDRTSFILKKSKENPFDFLKEDIESVDKLNPDFYVITCNTAHFFYDDLQKLTQKPIINMIGLVENECLYGDVKEKGIINFERYHNTLKEMMDEGCDYIIIGCTEGSYINSKDENSNLYPLIDSEKELVNESLKLGLKLQKNIEI